MDIAEKAIVDSGISANKLCFEITETAAISNIASAKTFLGRLRNLGCRFALDDFGSGIASFGYLRELPLDFIKIDGSFVRNLQSDSLSPIIIKTVCDLARVLGMKTIAESVEDLHVLDQLRDLGVDYVQGYALGRPGPISG